MSKAARAIVIEGERILVMRRNKNGQEYFTLVGGGVKDDESLEDAVAREVKEETGLVVTASKLAFTEDHPEPYAQQYIFLCNVAPHGNEIALAEDSEEQALNKKGENIHTPLWANKKQLSNMPFRTPALQQAIVLGMKKGFPRDPVQL